MNTRTVKFAGNNVALAGRELKVGAKAPNFSVIDGAMKEVTLDSFKGRVKFISIFPSIDTGVCSLQTKKFNERAGAYNETVAFLSISVDLPFALKRFCGSEGIANLTPLSDHQRTDFGLNYGFLIDGPRLLARGVVIIDRSDVVQYVELVPDIGQEPNYDAAIAALNKLV